MNLEKVIHRFSTAPHDRTELRRLARALGSELSREQLEVLRSFRAELVRVPEVVEADTDIDPRSYAVGYVASMLDVTAEYETHVRKDMDEQTLEHMVTHEGWRDILLLLRQGPRLPSEMADELGEDRSKITRALQKLRAAGLVQAYPSDSPDGRKKPHRLTVLGRRIASGLDTGVSPDVARGIRVAVGLFRHLLTNLSSSASALEDIAGEMLGDEHAASEAVRAWAEESKQAGLISEGQGDYEQIAANIRPSDGVPQPMLARGSEAVRSTEDPWQTAPAVIREIMRRDPEHMPVYVRTNDRSWGAWTYALGKLESPGRTIVDGDIASHSVEPPEQRFLLVYDDPEAVRADRDEPTMQAFMERAESKFVVASPGDNMSDMPEGFIPLTVPEEDSGKGMSNG